MRVNPAVPLWNILPAVCEKCEFQHENVALLRDAISTEELDMSQSLNDLGIKELYAWNNKQGKCPLAQLHLFYYFLYFILCTDCMLYTAVISHANFSLLYASLISDMAMTRQKQVFLKSLKLSQF